MPFIGQLFFLILDSLIPIKSKSIFVLLIRYLISSLFLEEEYVLI